MTSTTVIVFSPMARSSGSGYIFDGLYGTACDSLLYLDLNRLLNASIPNSELRVRFEPAVDMQ